MKTRINEKPKRRRLWPRLRADWADKLPLKTLAIVFAVLIAAGLLLLINTSSSSYLDQAEVGILRSRDILRVGVDTSVFGLSNNGTGLEIVMTEALSEAVFGEMDACEAVPCTRQNVAWYFADGKIDLAIMSLPSLSGYTATELPFYIDAVVLMGYGGTDTLEGKKIAVLYGTATESVLKKYIETETPAAVMVRYADYYDMLLALRAGTVDYVCMTRTAALSHKTEELVILPGKIGTVEYHIITRTTETSILNVCEALLTRWISDGTLGRWYKQFRLTY